MTPTILQVISDTDRRGAQVFAVDLHEALQRRGLKVRTVAIVRGSYGDLLDVPILGPSRWDVRTLAALRRNASAASVVVGHGSSALLAGALASLSAATPFVYRQISDQLFWAGTFSRRLRVQAFLRRATRVVALWSGAADVLAEHFGVARARIAVIPNGVPAGRCPPVDASARAAARARFDLPAAAPVLVYMGALVPEKGVDVAIGAVGLRPGWHLLVVGSGPAEDDLRRTAALTAWGRVHFSGPLRTPWDALAAADVVVLPSRGGDSMPAVLIESGLAGIPCVSTPMAAIPEIVVDGTTGALVAPDDAVGLARGIGRVLARRSQLGEAARRHCYQRFEIDVVAARWAGILEEAAGRRALSPVARWGVRLPPGSLGREPGAVIGRPNGR